MEAVGEKTGQTPGKERRAGCISVLCIGLTVLVRDAALPCLRMGHVVEGGRVGLRLLLLGHACRAPHPVPSLSVRALDRDRIRVHLDWHSDGVEWSELHCTALHCVALVRLAWSALRLRLRLRLRLPARLRLLLLAWDRQINGSMDDFQMDDPAVQRLSR